MNLLEILMPYHLTENPCVVFRLNITGPGFFRIEKKLPGQIKKISGIFVSASALNTTKKFVGSVSLAFNGDGLRARQFLVPKTSELLDTWRPLITTDFVISNSLVQGYYQDLSQSSVYPYSIKIYIHYKKSEND